MEMISYHFFFLLLGLAVIVVAKVQMRRIKPKILGGKITEISDVPYQVSVQYNRWHGCGGTIVRPSWILTAAHCVRKGTVTDYSIRAGSNLHFSDGVVIKASKILRHPLFDEDGTNNFDAALLKLETPLKFNEDIKSIPLTETDPKEGDLILISGWGSMKERSHFSKTLQATKVPIVSREKCRRAYKSDRHIFRSMFCAGFAAGKKDACRGDSGGPAVFDGHLVGIISWGRGCGRANTPGVYINITMIKLWVESRIR